MDAGGGKRDTSLQADNRRDGAQIRSSLAVQTHHDAGEVIAARADRVDGHLSCLQTQLRKRRLSVWRIHPSTPATSRRPRSQNLARPKDMAAERPARSAPRRGAAAYGVAYMASENPISKENNTLWQHTTVHTHVT